MPSQPGKVTRRGFMLAITGSAIAVAAGCRPSDVVVPTVYAPGSGARPTEPPQATLTGQTVAVRDPKYGEITYNKMVLTDVENLYVTQYDYGNTPRINAEAWQLVVDGLVENPLTLTYDDIRAMPVYEGMRTLECISNPVGGNLIGNLIWKGFKFEEILNRVKVKPETTHVRFEAADGYSTSVRLEWITQPGTMLAYEMNGEPLTTTHGFPLRIHMPGLYGQKMPRWLTRIEFIDYDYTGYWESRGWSNIAEIRTKSIIRVPPKAVGVQAGAIVALQGIAFAGKREIAGVEVQIEEGEWMAAELTRGPSPLAWTQWHLTWVPPAPGEYKIAVRATDDTGFVQESQPGGLFGNAFPNGTDAVHAITVKALRDDT